MSAHQADVLIVGAGMAGLSAAEVFLAKGWRVRVLDKARKAGGRCATRRTQPAADAAWFDTGAQYFTARDPRFCAWLEPWLKHHRVDQWHAHLGRGAPQVAVTVDDAQVRYAGVGGMNAWLSAWAQQLQAQGMELFCQTKVTRIDDAGAEPQVSCEDGRVWQAPHLVVTAPAEQTRVMLPSLGDLARWPRLGPCLAMTVLARPPWAWDGLFAPHPDVAWMASNSTKPGAVDTTDPLWTVHAGPSLSERACADQVMAVAELEAIVADLMAGPITTQHVHLWRYATASRQVVGNGFLRSPQSGRVYAAGDWLHGGRVEGAWLSGHRAAQACSAALAVS